MALTVKPLDKVRKTIPVKDVGKSSSHEIVRVNIQVKKETRILWHTEAMKRDMSLTDLIQKSVDYYIEK